jgi:hypothetical protein
MTQKKKGPGRSQALDFVESLVVERMRLPNSPFRPIQINNLRHLQVRFVHQHCAPLPYAVQRPALELKSERQAPTALGSQEVGGANTRFKLSPQRPPNHGQHLSRQKVDGLRHLGKGPAANVDLGQETLVAEYLVFVQDLVYDLLRVADEDAYFSPSWTAFQPDGGRGFRVIVDGISV